MSYLTSASATIHLRLSHTPGEIRAALTGPANTLLDFALWRPCAPDGLHDVFHARVTAHAPALAGYFLALPGTSGFLPETAGRFAEGDLLTVRVIRAAQGGKGPRLALAGEPTPPGATPGLVRRGPSPLHRLALANPEAPILTSSAPLLPLLRQDFGARARLAADAFEPVADAAEALEQAWADLPGGMRAGFFPTPALTAIDLDAAAAAAGRQAKAQAQIAANLAALPALAAQLRLRNLSGVILIDPAGIAARRRKALAPAFAAALASDPAAPRLLGFTGSGLAEILRPRFSPPLHELLASPLGQGLAALRRAAPMLAPAGTPASPRPAGRLVLRATADVLAAVSADSHALSECESLYGLRPDLQEVRCDTTPICTLE